jgi:hypothetical protein
LKGGAVVRNRVSLVLLPIDDFTDKVITEKVVNVKILNSNLRPIRKQDGFIVFTNIEEPKIAVIISGHFYNAARVEIDITRLNELSPIIKVRLKPNEVYSFPKNTTCLRGKTIPNTTLTVIHKSKFNTFRLFEDNKKGAANIKIYNPINLDLEGRDFIITDKNGKAREEFTIVEYDDENKTYTLNKALKKEYKKEVCMITKIDYVDVFEDGEFFLPLRNIVSGENTITIENNSKVKKEIVLEEGIINSIDIF